jgi:hypothetical protein
MLKILQPINIQSDENNSNLNTDIDIYINKEKENNVFIKELNFDNRKKFLGEFSCSKENFIKEILKIKKIIIDLDINIDSEYLLKLNILEKSFFAREKTQYDKNYKINNLKSLKRSSSVCKNFNYKKSNIFNTKFDKNDSYFIIKIYLCSIGNIPFFTVEISERDNIKSDIEEYSHRLKNTEFESNDSLYLDNKSVLLKKTENFCNFNTNSNTNINSNINIDIKKSKSNKVFISNNFSEVNKQKYSIKTYSIL